jgi:hypothetical protein
VCGSGVKAVCRILSAEHQLTSVSAAGLLALSLPQASAADCDMCMVTKVRADKTSMTHQCVSSRPLGSVLAPGPGAPLKQTKPVGSINRAAAAAAVACWKATVKRYNKYMRYWDTYIHTSTMWDTVTRCKEDLQSFADAVAWLQHSCGLKATVKRYNFESRVRQLDRDQIQQWDIAHLML